jgi:hypothetical protein
MPSPVAVESFELSREHFAQPESYAHFTYTDDDRFIIDCIEPRNPLGTPHGSYDVTIQGPGGGSGEALVGGIALTIVRGELVSVEEALVEDEEMRIYNILAGHLDCTFIREMRGITGEMVDPTDKTLENYTRLGAVLGHKDLVQSSLPKIKEAGALQLEDMQDKAHMEHLLAHIDRLHPEHSNVKEVEGNPGAMVYVQNLHPNIGQDRNKHSLKEDGTQAVRAYHDSVAAALVELDKATELSNEERGLRVAARIMLSAATLTVIEGANPGIAIFEVMRSTSHSSGRQIIEVQS